MWKRYLAKTVGSILVLSALWGCGSSGNNNHTNTGTNAGPAVGFVVTTDFSVGNLSTLTTTTPRTATKNVLGATGLHSDSAIRAFGGMVFVIQRFGANSIVVLDPNHPGVPLANYTTNDPGTGSQQSNPVDMEFVGSSKAYISRYGLNTILIVDPLTGAQLDKIDLSQFADSDGLVEMDQMVIAKGKLYVALQRLNNFSASNDSYVVVIDTATDQIVDVDSVTPGIQPIVLQGRNPLDLVYLPSTNRIYLANVGTFFTTFSTDSTADPFGGIEAINPDTNTTEGIVLADEAFRGPLGTFGVLSDTVGYATVFDANFNNFVVPFNLSTGKIDTPLTGIGSGTGLVFDDNGFLYVVDRDITNPGIQVFDPATKQKVEGPIDTGLPPGDLVFVTS
ncbi:MAG: hypothetical protein HZA19_06215 [Nitrospirae bacterium]|nr:hypothetical protein [Nitrospirota bacterium]